VTASATACQRAGCAGHYAADGYCDECGHKAPATVTGGLSVATAAGGYTSATGAGLGGSSSSRSGRSRSAGRGRLGASLVAVPPVPLRDPATAVMKDPQVPESHRVCSTCGEPVGRSRDGKPGRVQGFCPKDRTPFNFRPKLSPGDRVDDRYEILGALAHGGLGWIYLARDRNISSSGADRWVVLKGLLNSGDPDALAAAVAERRFLVEVDHPNIVKIHDLVEHPDPDTGENVGYIVMEYVGGRSLKDLALTHLGPDGRRAPLPLDQVLAYGIEVLPALGYLHDRDLLFCDFKPDNVIHAEEQLKLIDLGAVRRMDDQTSPLWGTPGYQAPELATRGASIASDIYTVGRALAVLSFSFTGFSTTYAKSLPSPADVPLLREQESFHRLLLRATDADPAQRFASATEMAEQALGVLREILAAADGRPRPAISTVFTPERHAFGTAVTGALAATAAPGPAAGSVPAQRGRPGRVTTPAAATVEGGLNGAEIAAALPLPLVDPADPAAGFLATVGGTDPAATIDALRRAPQQTVEVTLRLVRALLETGQIEAALTELGKVPGAGGEWRHHWYAGLVALAAGRPDQARQAFEAVYTALPGEPAAQLALAAACELGGDRDGARRRYLHVWRVDHSYVSAAFGLARMLLAGGDRAGAVAVLDEVPDSSSHHVAAQVAAVRAALDHSAGVPAQADMLAASSRLERIRLDQQRRAALAAEMLHAALEWLRAGTGSGATAPANSRFLGAALQEREIRLGLEQAYRTLASLEPEAQARWALVDQANAVRPRTLV
jgi:serine/threonine-protein kinase PknG